MKKEAFYRKLVHRYLDGEASEEEYELFFHLVKEGKLDPYLMEADADEQPITSAGRRPAGKTLPVRWIYRVAAAAVLLFLVAGALLWKNGRKAAIPATANTFQNDLRPGGEHAILTLNNGARIKLDSAGKGPLANQGDAQIFQVQPGSLSYKVPAASSKTVYYNTLSTPAGGEYQVTLSDGTRVWLNALSAIKFPTSFNGDSRKVELTGEAYFEVAKDKKKPFQVIANGMGILVLGTSFDVYAYPDETSTKTTLVSGAVKLVKDGHALVLGPGQQGETVSNSGLQLEEHADVEKALAWKNGYFSFEGEHIQAVMHQIARWYGIEVRYEGNPPDELYGGQIGRNLMLSEVLAGLTASNVHYKLEGTVLTILHN